MPRKLASAPRKAPRQARAQVTVTAILEAATRIFEEDGMDAATTTRIAEVAGVSVGTLYQYFADRDAILDALQDREFERALALMGTVLSNENLTRSPRETINAVVRGLGALYASSPALHRVLVIEGLRVTEPARVEAFDLRVVAIIRHFLVATGARVRRGNVEAAAFVAFQAVRAVMLACLLERPPGLDESTLRGELVDLVMRYLVDDDDDTHPSGSKAKRSGNAHATGKVRPRKTRARRRDQGCGWAPPVRPGAVSHSAGSRSTCRHDARVISSPGDRVPIIARHVLPLARVHVGGRHWGCAGSPDRVHQPSSDLSAVRRARPPRIRTGLWPPWRNHGRYSNESLHR